MPQGDKTGPAGQGSKTGRARGFCAGFNAPGFMSFGRGMRRRGFGLRARATQPIPTQQTQSVVITKKQEKQFLEQDLKALKKEIKEIEKRLKEFKN